MQRPIALKPPNWLRLRIMVALVVLAVVGFSDARSARPVALAMSGTCPAPAVNVGVVSIPMTVTTTGTYRVWSRVMASSSTNNSYLLDIDGASCFTVGDNAAAAPTGQWTWIDFQSAVTSNKINTALGAGAHTFKLIGREPSVKIDRVIVVIDTTCIPSGTGNNCATTITPAKTPGATVAPGHSATPAPHVTGPVTVITPSSPSAPVSGKVAIAIPDGSERFVVKVDGQPIEGNQIDTTELTNGPHTVTVQATDINGKTTTTTRQIETRNKLTPWQTVRNQLVAGYEAHPKLTLGLGLLIPLIIIGFVVWLVRRRLLRDRAIPLSEVGNNPASEIPPS